jgi:nucleoside-diphosphate-sugar epimerase
MITGATGFLGGALANRLLDDGAQVRLLARSPEKARRLAARGADVFEGELNDADAARRAAEGCACLFHVAGATSGSLAKQRATNVEGTRAVLLAAADAGVKRFVHVSTISAYGYNYDGDVTEDMALGYGADPYAKTKAVAEQLVRETANRRGIAYSIIRPGMIYGPRSGLWTGTLFQLARLNPTPFAGDGSGSIHTIFVDDVVEMMVTMATHPAAENEVFNCSADPTPTWREFLQGYSRLAGHQNWLALPVPLFRVVAGIAMLLAPRDTIMRDLPDLLTLLQSHTTFKTSKAQERLGWSAKVSMEEGIRRCEPWLREKGLLG